MEVFVEIVSFFAAFAARKAAFFMPFFSCCSDSGFFMSFIWLITPILLVCDRLPAVYLHEIYRDRPIEAEIKIYTPNRRRALYRSGYAAGCPDSKKSLMCRRAA